MRKWRTKRAAAFALLIAVLVVAAGCGGSRPKGSPGDPAELSAGNPSDAAYIPSGTLVADSTFRPGDNGFLFQNYGDVLPDGSIPTNMTADDLRLMFGDVVCADARPSRCDLIPPAAAWLKATNQAMAGGHCYGFSVAAQQIWQQRLDISKYGAAAIRDLAIDNNQPLQRRIAYDWALQLLGSVRSGQITGSPNQILDKLARVLKPSAPETYTIAFFKPDMTGGHAVTPYAIENRGSGKFNVLIYDNNWPTESRAITFDTRANTWMYDAAINPDQPNEIYRGNGKTKTLSLFPTSPGTGTQPCPFCRKRPRGLPSTGTTGSAANTAGSVPATSTEEIYLDGGDTNHANLLVTDEAGHRLGYAGGKLVNEIPGGQVEGLITNQNWKERAEPNLIVPADGTYTVTIDGAVLSRPDTETLGIIGPSFDLSVRDIPVKPGDIDRLVAGPFATRLSYSASRPEAPTIDLAVSDNRADYDFQVGGVGDQAGSTINLALPLDDSGLTMANDGSSRTSAVSITMTRYTDQGTQMFSDTGIALAANDSDRLEFGNWTGGRADIPFVSNHQGQTSTTLLTDQAPG
jgi:hypothetical protein